MTLQKYIGTKVIKAVGDSRMAVKDGKPGYRVIYKDGYESWSPQSSDQQLSALADQLTFL